MPPLFAPYAEDLVRRLGAVAPQSILEIAAGSGVVTRAMAARLPSTVEITATDLNPAMIARARSVGTARPVRWRDADAMSLPFEDASFDAVTCQFGVMFFPDRVGAYAEIARVLRPGGTFLFNVWDAIEHNTFADVVNRAVGDVFPDDRPAFVTRTPHGYCDTAIIEADLEVAGFAPSPAIEVVEARSRARSAESVALGFCQGTPLRGEIEARDPSRLDAATAAAGDALGRRFGQADLEGGMRAFVVTATT